jgi:hypothetical protein
MRFVSLVPTWEAERSPCKQAPAPVLCDVTSCRSTVRRRFGGARNTYYSSILEMETFWRKSQTTRRHIPEDSTLHSHRCEDLKSGLAPTASFHIPCNSRISSHPSTRRQACRVRRGTAAPTRSLCLPDVNLSNVDAFLYATISFAVMKFGTRVLASSLIHLQT